MTQPILQIDRLTKQFDKKSSPAVDRATLTLDRGDILSFLGPSGCGKTTLLRLIAGFEQPEVGTVKIGDRICAGNGNWIPPEQRDVGMVFQDYALFPHLSVAKNVAFGLQHFDRTESIDRVAEVLKLVGLAGLDHRYPHQLSGGQQQRVALARAIAPRPALVLLDEPLSNLDVQIRLRLRQELRDILKEEGTSAIIVTHDQEEALAISDLVAVIQSGRIEQFGSPLEIYRQPASRFVAEFVTQANFLPARHLHDRLWETEIGCFSLDRVFTNLDRAEIMIRQEDLELEVDRDPDRSTKVTIRDRSFIGRELVYYLRTASGQDLLARTNADRLLSIGTSVKVSVKESSVRDLQIFPLAPETNK